MILVLFAITAGYFHRKKSPQHNCCITQFTIILGTLIPKCDKIQQKHNIRVVNESLRSKVTGYRLRVKFWCYYAFIAKLLA